MRLLTQKWLRMGDRLENVRLGKRVGSKSKISKGTCQTRMKHKLKLKHCHFRILTAVRIDQARVGRSMRHKD